MTVNDEVLDYVSEIEKILSEVVLEKPLKHNDLRFTVDKSDESLGKKIRRATSMKIPVVLIVGPKDKEARIVSLRMKDVEKTIELREIVDFLKNLD